MSVKSEIQPKRLWFECFISFTFLRCRNHRLMCSLLFVLKNICLGKRILASKVLETTPKFYGTSSMPSKPSCLLLSFTQQSKEMEDIAHALHEYLKNLQEQSFFKG